MKSAGFGVLTIVRRKIGPQEEGGRSRDRIAGIFAGHRHERGSAPVELPITHQPASRLIGSKSGQGNRLLHLLELSRCLGVAIEAGYYMSAREAVFPCD